jgi:MFS family permease
LSASAATLPTAANSRRVALGLLLAAYTLSYLDRQIVGSLLEPIKSEFALSDTQLGFLSGTAFALFYATLGIPVAWLADRGNRKRIILWSLGIWSVMTAVCGFAQSFTQLVMARIGVGIGEAGSSPPSHSIIADLYAREERSGAMGVLALGAYIGSALGTFVGGLVAQEYGWRAALLVAGLPGLVLVAVIKYALVEPPRQAPEARSRVAGDRASIADGFRAIAASPALYHLIAGITLLSFIAYGKAQWTVSFVVRSYGLDIGAASLIVAPVTLLAGGGGALLGGRLADYFGRRDPRYCAWVIVVGQLASMPFLLGWYFATDLRVGVPLYFCSAVLAGFYLGPSFAMIQTLAPVRQRATVAAIMLFILNLIGLGLGPQLVGLASDLLAPRFGAESLRYAMAVASLAGAWGAFHYWRGGVHYAREIAVPSGD